MYEGTWGKLQYKDCLSGFMDSHYEGHTGTKAFLYGNSPHLNFDTQFIHQALVIFVLVCLYHHLLWIIIHKTNHNKATLNNVNILRI